MIRRLQITLLVLFVGVWAMASNTSVKNADGVEIWYDFDSNAKTASVTYKGSYYNSYSNEYTGEVVIPSKVTYEGEEYSVTEIGSSAFYGCSSLTSITIPESVTVIGSYAFYGCYRLYEVYNKSNLVITAGSSENGGVAYYAKNVYTDDSGESKLHTAGDYIFYVDEDNIDLLVYLGDEIAITLPSDYEGKDYIIANYAFYCCSSLTSITIPKGVTEIGDYAFYRCSSLTSITIPEGVTSIGGYAFSGCSGLTSITLPKSVTSIGGGAFRGCSTLTSITIAEGVTEIGEVAFYGCNSLTSITLPESVKSIGDDAFSFCSSLTSITIPEGVTSIGIFVFDGCSSLTSIDVALDNNSYTSINGVLFSKDKTILIKYPEGKKDVTSYAIPASVTSIGGGAFFGCSSLTSLTIPERVIEIGDWAFGRCSSLTSITLPESVKAIGFRAFSDCSSLTSITSMNVRPPSIYTGYTFDGVDKYIPVYVPKQSVDAYKSASYWNYFKNIQGIDDIITPISDVVADSVSIRLIGNSLIVEGTESYAVYALSGQCLGKVESLERGLYIVVADGVSKRIVVK